VTDKLPLQDKSVNSVAGYLEQIRRAETLEEEDQLREQLAAESANNPENLRLAVLDITLPEEDYLLGEVYEALAEHDPVRWQDFFAEDIDRIINLARSRDDKGQVLAALDQFIVISFQPEESLRKRIRDALYPKLNWRDDLIRRKCVQTICDFVDDNSKMELSKLEWLLNHDSDWRIRYHAQETLVETDPARYGELKLSLADRIRSRFLDPDEPKSH